MIKDKKTRDKLLKSFPKVSDKELTELSKKYMPQYVVYKQIKRGVYECYCTRCEKHYINDTVSGREYVPLIRHGEMGSCLACGGVATFLARGKGRRRIWDSQNFAVFKSKGGKVYIQTYQICAGFTEHGKTDFGFNTGDIYGRDIYPRHRYVLTPEGAQKWSHWWHYNYKANNYTDAWEETTSESGPDFRSASSTTAAMLVSVQTVYPRPFCAMHLKQHRSRVTGTTSSATVSSIFANAASDQISNIL